VRRQVVELPVMKPLVIEYRLHALHCRRCGTTTRAELPNDGIRCTDPVLRRRGHRELTIVRA